MLRAGNPEQARHVVFDKLRPHTRKNGAVVYRVKDGGLVVDEAQAIRVEELTAHAAFLALSLASERFVDQALIVEGSDEFKRQIAGLAGSKQLDVRFADPAIEAERQRHAAKVAPSPPAPDALETFIASRNALRSKIPSISPHRAWTPADAGEATFEGCRHLARRGSAAAETGGRDAGHGGHARAGGESRFLDARSDGYRRCRRPFQPAATNERPPMIPAYETPRRRHVALIAVAAVIFILAVNSAATQFAAHRLSYHPALGAPWAGKVYAPWAWIGWRAQFYDQARTTFDLVTAGFGAAGVMASLALMFTVGLQGRSAKRHEGVHGTAHWASRAEIEATGLLPRRGKSGAGVYVGGWTDAQGQLHYLRHDGPEHVAAIAPTRSGKGVGLVIPTLLSWPHSVVVNDMKAELWNSTAAWREKHGGNVVMRFDPGSPEGSVAFQSARRNPPGHHPRSWRRAESRNHPRRSRRQGAGRSLGENLATPSSPARCCMFSTKPEAAGRSGTLPDVSRALSDPAQPIDALYKEMLANKWGPDGALHDIIAASARDMTNRPEDERGSVLSTAMSFLSLYRDPLVAKNVSASDFSISDLMNHEKPVTLYLIVRAEDKDRMKPLMRLIINLLVRVLLRPEITFAGGRPVTPHKHRLLLMLDEFPSYGRLEVFQEALAYIAGYGIKAYLIMQDIAQLWGAYGHDESIMSNCHVRVAYAPNKIETAEWLSRMAGTMTVVKEDITTTGNRFSAVLQNVSRTFHEVAGRWRRPMKSCG